MLVALLAAPLLAQGPPTSRPADRETLVGDTTGYDQIKALVMSNDAKHLAFLGVKGNKQYIVTDNHQGPAFDWVLPDSLFILPTGESAYIVQNDDAMQACIAGRLDKPVPSIEFNRMFVSPDGKQVAYIAVLANKKMAVVLDGQQGPIYDAIDFPLFSPDSRHLAYRATTGGAVRIVLDGQEQPAYDAIVGLSLSFSFDSKRLGYEAVRKGGQHVIVIDGQVAAQCNELRAGPGFSPDSLHWAAAMAANPADPQNTKTVMILDGKVGPTFDAIFSGDMRFSPDSKHFACAAMKDGKAFIVLDGKPQPPVDDIGAHTLVFSPDSLHHAFAAMIGADQAVVEDGKPLKPWKAIESGTPVFSPDSKQIAYVGQEGIKWIEVINGKEMDPWDLAGVPLYSPDSRRFAYRTVTGKRAQAVVDGVASPLYDGVGPISFSPDSRHTIYVIRDAGVSRICVDGAPSVASYDLHTPDAAAMFDDANTAHLISVRDGKFYLVTVKMGG